MKEDRVTTAIHALMRAAGLDLAAATKAFARLEREGLTIYKKKVHKNERRPTASRSMTPKLATAIRAYFAAYPDATQQAIANLFNVNIGRVNEALDGLHGRSKP